MGAATLLRFKSTGAKGRWISLILSGFLWGFLFVRPVSAIENAAADSDAPSVSVPSNRPLAHDQFLDRLSGAAHQMGMMFTLPPPLSSVATDYLKAVMVSIQQNARHVPGLRAYKGDPIEIFFKIDDRGRIERLKILKRSGNPYFDDLAAETVRRSAPFAPPPKDAKHALIWRVTPTSTGTDVPR